MLVQVRKLGIGTLILLGVLFLVDLTFPPPLHKAQDFSDIITDREARWLHVFSNDENRWRFRTRLDQVDATFVERLILVEDERFYHHPGVDPLAIGRASLSAVKAGRIVSGASTITMQTARLLEPRKRTIGAKLIEAFRAIQIERRLSKKEILELYLSLAPYGGNIEGVRAASHLYFDKEPLRLTNAEQALLIALPQAPEARRPDLRKEGAKLGRREILERLVAVDALTEKNAAEANDARLPSGRALFDQRAYHAAKRAVRSKSAIVQDIKTTLDREVQLEAERILTAYVDQEFDDGATASAIVIDNQSGEIRALIGSSGINVDGGWIDLTSAVRSPGSLLKPFIYGKAFEDGILAPDSIVSDMPRGFGEYRPENFDRSFRGEVSVSDALQHSLNVPAVDALQRIGPVRFIGDLFSMGSGIKQKKGADQKAGLAIALGGAGLTLEDIAMLYFGLANDGFVRRPTLILDTEEADVSKRFLSAKSVGKINSILRAGPTLAGRSPAALSVDAPLIAYKTGTSYGFRDAWAAGHGGGLTIAVWTGRADGAPRPGMTGRRAAAPLMFQLFDALGERQTAIVEDSLDEQNISVVRAIQKSPPQIVFPQDGVTVLYEMASLEGVRLSAEGGDGAFSWYVDGEPVKASNGYFLWKPKKEGFYDVRVYDASGQHMNAKIRVEKG